jgi:Domain of unkown function (DUF1775)
LWSALAALSWWRRSCWRSLPRRWHIREIRTRSKLAQPQTNDEGEKVTDRVDTITWTGDGEPGRIAPGQFQDFGLSVAVPDQPGPADADDNSDSGAPTWLAVLALVVGALGLIAGVGALTSARKRAAV